MRQIHCDVICGGFCVECISFGFAVGHAKFVNCCRETALLCRTVGFDALLAIKAGEVAQGRRIMEEVVAAPR